MKFPIAAAFLLFASLAPVGAQQAGTLEQEGNPTITLKECTIAGGCTSRQAKLTLDANWRWIHKTSGSQNCYTGDKWDSQICSDPVQCAKDCAVEGITSQKYKDTYGIEQIQDGVKMQFVTEHQHGANIGGRLYVMDTDDNYELFYLKNREFSFEVDVSELQCGMNGAMYFSEMAANGGKGIGSNNAGAKYGTGYCDAQCPHDIKFIDGEANVIDWHSNPNDHSGNMGAGKYGSCCAEMDIWEANSMANAFTPHTCGMEGQLRCEGTDCGDNDKGERYDGVCDKDGCDINPYRMGDTSFYGRGPGYMIDTTRPMTVVTQFLTTDGTDSGDFSEMRRFYVQDGKIIKNPSSTILGPHDSDSITDEFCDAKKDLFDNVKDFQELGGMKGMGESLDRGHAMIFSLWDDVEVNMLWLDSAYPLDKPVTDPGIKRGDCPGGEESTPTFLRENYPNAYVSFKNAAVGEIGSTVIGLTASPTKSPTTSPPTTTPEGCFSNNYKDCLPDGYDSDSTSCDKIWLPKGSQKNCVALWGKCANQPDSCCGPATCYGNNDNAACVPDPTSSPTPQPCIVCDNKPTKSMLKKGQDCDDKPGQLNKNCNKSSKWILKNSCQLSCYKSGNGYEGDVCCNA